eukprot:1364179-Amphidinium_carterae.1
MDAARRPVEALSKAKRRRTQSSVHAAAEGFITDGNKKIGRGRLDLKHCPLGLYVVEGVADLRGHGCGQKARHGEEVESVNFEVANLANGTARLTCKVHAIDAEPQPLRWVPRILKPQRVDPFEVKLFFPRLSRVLKPRLTALTAAEVGAGIAEGGGKVPEHGGDDRLPVLPDAPEEQEGHHENEEHEDADAEDHHDGELIEVQCEDEEPE